jgi:tRNA-splicing ligase RtcB (3'-phosphate/5'-hydroxy nucleic acid ligase)
MPVLKTISKGKVPVKVYSDEIEPEAMQQLYNISQLPIIHSHIAAVPDVHPG